MLSVVLHVITTICKILMFFFIELIGYEMLCVVTDKSASIANRIVCWAELILCVAIMFIWMW